MLGPGRQRSPAFTCCHRGIFELFARSFVGGTAASTGSTVRPLDRGSARSLDGFGLFVGRGADAGRAGASRSVAGGAAWTGSAGRLADFVDSWPAVTRTWVIPARFGSAAVCRTTPSLVVTVATGPSASACTSTAKMVPRTDAVELGVRTS